MLFNSVLESMSERGLNDNSQLTISALCNNNSDPLSVDLEPAPIEVAVATTVTTAGFSDIMEYFATQTQQNESPYFYHGDHLGSASWITDASGIPVQHLQYLPFGEPFVNQHTSGYKERFTFTGKERDEETGFSYFGARYYDSDLSGLFLSVDPMANKYPSISPYAYCAWNPIKIIDPNGDTIKPAPNSSEKFISQLNDAIQCLVDNGAGNLVSELNKRTEIIHVSELPFSDAYSMQYNPTKNEISWCPTAGMLTSENVKLSPATSLNHEFDHCLEHLVNPETQTNNYKTPVLGYRNAEEQRVITGSEQKTARCLKEITDGQVTRYDHSGTLYETNGPTSNQPLNPNQEITPPLSPNLKPVTIRSSKIKP